MSFPSTAAVFCKVVDNYGDIGICWRLARQLGHEHHVAVTLWVDDLVSFQRLCPEVQGDLPIQQLHGVTIRHWTSQDGVWSSTDIADLVIEFFGCDIPPGYIAAMAQCEPRPVWINLEGLTAEEWVEGCHTLPSPHPQFPLTKFFFFPGFTRKTGGLLHESTLENERLEFQSDPAAQSGFLSALGLTTDEQQACKVSLFCYTHAPIDELFDSLQQSGSSVVCLVPEGVARDKVQTFLASPATPGAVRTRGTLTVRVVPFLPQPDYDRLLWTCDVNFVRGEDSFVRAQWAGKPFIWHIYPQDNHLHHKKLRAFLQRYAAGLDSLAAYFLHWNDALAGDSIMQSWPRLWIDLQRSLPAIETSARAWQKQMRQLGDLTGNLLAFARDLRSKPASNRV